MDEDAEIPIRSQKQTLKSLELIEIMLGPRMSDVCHCWGFASSLPSNPASHTFV